MTAGVESTNGPIGRFRTAAITTVASDTLRFMYGASVAALAVVNAMMVPAPVTVYRFRLFESVDLQPVSPGTHATQRRVPSALNFHPDNCVESVTGLYWRKPRKLPLNPGSVKPAVTSRFERCGSCAPALSTMTVFGSAAPLMS